MRRPFRRAEAEKTVKHHSCGEWYSITLVVPYSSIPIRIRITTCGVKPFILLLISQVVAPNFRNFQTRQIVHEKEGSWRGVFRHAIVISTAKLASTYSKGSEARLRRCHPTALPTSRLCKGFEKNSKYAIVGTPSPSRMYSRSIMTQHITLLLLFFLSFSFSLLGLHCNGHIICPVQASSIYRYPRSIALPK
jgi:hypothetical protein